MFESHSENLFDSQCEGETVYKSHSEYQLLKSIQERPPVITRKLRALMDWVVKLIYISASLCWHAA